MQNIKLNRNEVAPFFLSEAKKLAQAELISIKSGLEKILPSRTLSIEEEREIHFGRPISKSENEITAAYLPDGEFVSLLTNKEQSGKILSFPSLVNVKE